MYASQRCTFAMPSQLRLSPLQAAVLRWIGDGSPPGIMDAYGHRISAAALRSRGLIKISGRSRSWRAQITPAGRALLDSMRLPRETDANRPDAAPSATDLTADQDRGIRRPQPPRPSRKRPGVVAPT